MSKLFYLALNNIKKKMDNADQGVASSTASLHYPVRKSAVAGLNDRLFTQNPGHPPGSGRPPRHCIFIHRILDSHAFAPIAKALHLALVVRCASVSTTYFIELVSR